MGVRVIRPVSVTKETYIPTSIHEIDPLLEAAFFWHAAKIATSVLSKLGLSEKYKTLFSLTSKAIGALLAIGTGVNVVRQVQFAYNTAGGILRAMINIMKKDTGELTTSPEEAQAKKEIAQDVGDIINVLDKTEEAKKKLLETFVGVYGHITGYKLYEHFFFFSLTEQANQQKAQSVLYHSNEALKAMARKVDETIIKSGSKIGELWKKAFEVWKSWSPGTRGKIIFGGILLLIGLIITFREYGIRFKDVLKFGFRVVLNAILGIPKGLISLVRMLKSRYQEGQRASEEENF